MTPQDSSGPRRDVGALPDLTAVGRIPSSGALESFLEGLLEMSRINEVVVMQHLRPVLAAREQAARLVEADRHRPWWRGFDYKGREELLLVQNCEAQAMFMLTEWIRDEVRRAYRDGKNAPSGPTAPTTASAPNNGPGPKETP